MKTIAVLSVLSMALWSLASPSTGKSEIELKASVKVDSLAGFYAVRANGYQGMAMLLEAKPGICIVQYLTGNTSTGVGLRLGDNFSVGWSTERDGKLTRGVTVYRIEAGERGPVLHGKWVSLPGTVEPVEESLTWLRGLD